LIELTVDSLRRKKKETEMLFPTENDSQLGKIWNPFAADFTEEFKKELKENENKKRRAKMTLLMLAALG
jgi:hypothetical protein